MTSATNNLPWVRLTQGPSRVVVKYCDMPTVARIRTVCRAWQSAEPALRDKRNAKYGPELEEYCWRHGITLAELPEISPSEAQKIQTLMRNRGVPEDDMKPHVLPSPPIVRISEIGQYPTRQTIWVQLESTAIGSFLNDFGRCVGCNPLFPRDVGMLEIVDSEVDSARILGACAVTRLSPNYRKVLFGTHPVLRIAGDRRSYEAEAPIIATVITAATFALNWFFG